MQKHKTWHHCLSTKEINAYLTRAIAYSGAKRPQLDPTTFTFDPKFSVSSFQKVISNWRFCILGLTGPRHCMIDRLLWERETYKNTCCTVISVTRTALCFIVLAAYLTFNAAYSELWTVTNVSVKANYFIETTYILNKINFSV